jgi:hypothetical protein
MSGLETHLRASGELIFSLTHLNGKIPMDATGGDGEVKRTTKKKKPRGFDAPSMQAACDLMFPVESLREDPQYWSFSEVWDELSASVRNATYHHYPPGHAVDYARVDRYRRWVDHLFEFFTAERLQRSQAYPAPSESVRKIIEVIQRKIEDPVHNEPVRIIIMGGSVTAGRDCEVNPLDLPGSKVNGDTARWCTYTSRLEGLLNSVMFPSKRPKGGVRVRNGRYDGHTTRAATAAAASDDLLGDRKDYYPIFEVTNVAAQATDSQVGAMVLEHWLLPFLENEPPHIVISSYSANDAYEHELDVFGVNHQDWIRAARSLRPCDDHLPLVVLADDVYCHGCELSTALRQTGSIYKTASWYDVMAVAYPNVVRQVSDRSANFSEADGHPLFGSSRDSSNHPGMGFHMGQAWTLFFNLAGAMHAACTNPFTPPGENEEGDAADPDADPDADADARPEANGTNASARLTFKPWTDPHTKYRGRHRQNAKLVLQDWTRNEEIKARRCSDSGPFANATATKIGDGATPRPEYATRTCTYAWMVNSMTPVWDQQDVIMALGHVMTENDGWTTLDRPKAGWYTNRTTSDGSNSSFFAIELRNISAAASHLTVLSLKSYGEAWAGSRIKIEVEIESPPSAGSSRRPPRRAEYFVEGHHAKRISVSYPHRFRLPGGDAGGVEAKAGDTIRARFTNVGNTQFKISGLAFCELLMGEEVEEDE